MKRARVSAQTCLYKILYYIIINSKIHMLFQTISKRNVPAGVSRVYPAFRTQWNRFRKLIRSYARVIAINDQFELNRFKRISIRFGSPRTNGKPD